MNNLKIFQNSWSLMLRYRSLWIFGVILALTTVSMGSALWFRDRENRQDETLASWEISARDKAWIKENFGFDLPLQYTLEVPDLQVRLDDPSFSSTERARLLNVAATIMAVLFTLLLVTLVLRYSAETALIRMVHDQQENDVAHSARKGWSLGFSTAAFKLFMIDFVIFSMLLLLTPLLFLPDLLPALIAVSGRPAAIGASLLLMTSLSLLSLAALIVMWIAGLVARTLAFRAACLEGLGVFTSIWRGFRLMLTQLRGVGLTGLVLAGLDLVYPMLVVPVGLLLAALGLAVHGLLALILGSLLALILAKTTAWTIAIAIGAALVLLTVIVPLTFLGGLREVFASSAWTLTFNEAARNQEAYRPSKLQPAGPPAPPQVNSG